MDPLSKFRSFIYGLVYFIFNIYLWWLFQVVDRMLRQTQTWSDAALTETNRQIKVVRNTVIVGVIACFSALIWAPLTPLILALSPLIRDLVKAH